MNADRIIRTTSITVGELIRLLKYFPKSTPVRVIGDDGVDELPFNAPILSRINGDTPHEFVAINVWVEP